MLCNLPLLVFAQNKTQPYSRPYPNVQCSVRAPMRTSGQKTRPSPSSATPMASTGTTQMDRDKATTAMGD